MTEVMETNNAYRADYARFVQQNPANVAWLNALRQSGMETFDRLGFPTRHDEEWRFTPIGPIVETTFRRAERVSDGVTASDIAPLAYGAENGVLLVFVNGVYAPHLSSRNVPDGVTVMPLAEALTGHSAEIEPHLGRYAEHDNAAFVALNTAFLRDGAFILIPRGRVVTEPIHLLYVSTSETEPVVSYPRTLILAGENCQATIVESYAGLGDGAYLTNAVTEVVLGPAAVIDHYKVQRESRSAFHVGAMFIHLDRACNFSSHSIGLGGSIVRNDANAKLDAEHIECTLNGVYLASGRQIIDNHTAIDHAKPNCNSHEVYKGVIDDRGRGIFNGKIYVRLDAQKTDAKQTNQTLLLSEDAQINTKPQLEILADDVKCTHGATVGQLSDEALFYLRSRGLGKEEARSLLTYAFASDIVSRIKIDAVREQLDGVLLARLPKR